MAWESHSEKEMIIGKVIFEISRKNDVHNNYETDYSNYYNDRVDNDKLLMISLMMIDVFIKNNKLILFLN